MQDAESQPDESQKTSEAARYISLASDAKEAGLAELSDRLSAHARFLAEDDAHVASKEPIDGMVEGATRALQQLLRPGETRERVPLYVGIEGGRTTEAVLGQLFAVFGLPDLRNEPASSHETVAHGEIREEVLYQHETDHGVRFELEVAEFADGSRVVTLDAVRTHAQAA